MAWEASDRKSRLPSDWEARRNRIMKRDKGKCQWFDRQRKRRCLILGNQVDHKIAGDNHDDSNLQVLCEDHHKQKTQWEAKEAIRIERERRDALLPPKDRHPGLL